MPLDWVVPPLLDRFSFDRFLESVSEPLPNRPSLILDLGPLQRADAYAMAGLLSLGRRLRSRHQKIFLHLPVSPSAQHELAGMGFFSRAGALFILYPTHRKILPPTAGGAVLPPLPLYPLPGEPERLEALRRLRTGGWEIDPPRWEMLSLILEWSKAFGGSEGASAVEWIRPATGAPEREGLLIVESDLGREGEEADGGAWESGAPALPSGIAAEWASAAEALRALGGGGWIRAGRFRWEMGGIRAASPEAVRDLPWWPGVQLAAFIPRGA